MSAIALAGPTGRAFTARLSGRAGDELALLLPGLAAAMAALDGWLDRAAFA